MRLYPIILAMSKRKRSAVWSYFSGKGEASPVYTLCGESVKASGNTSNMLKHLQLKHPEEFRLIREEQEAAKRLKTKTPSTEGRQQTLAVAFEQGQGYTRESLRRKKINDALLSLLAVDLQPASIVEDKGSLSFLRVMDPKYQPPSRRTIMRSLLPEKYESVKQELKAKLGEIKFCSLTTDLWTSRATQSYLTVTCHFFSSDWVFTLRSLRLFMWMKHILLLI